MLYCPFCLKVTAIEKLFGSKGILEATVKIPSVGLSTSLIKYTMLLTVDDVIVFPARKKRLSKTWCVCVSLLFGFSHISKYSFGEWSCGSGEYIARTRAKRGNSPGFAYLPSC